MTSFYKSKIIQQSYQLAGSVSENSLGSNNGKMGELNLEPITQQENIHIF